MLERTFIFALANLISFHVFQIGAPVSGQLFQDPTLSSGDNFGFAVSVNDDRIMVGARRDDSMGTNIGQAHLFDIESGNLIATYDDPTPTIQDNFGSAVDFQQNVVLIGAPQDSTQGLLIGQAHIFNAFNGVLIRTFDDPTPSQSDFFGTSVGFFGNRIVIGAPGDDSMGNGVGQAHVYDFFTGELVTNLNDPTVTGFDAFGQSIAIDRNLIVVGDPGDDTNGFGVGQAHVFTAEDGSFVRTLNDPSTTASDQFGSSVAIYENLILVGAPGDDSKGENVGQVYLFDATDGSLIETFNHPNAALDSAFGASVALNSENVLVGSPTSQVNEEVTGQAFLFKISDGSLVLTYESDAPNVEDEFGFAVGMSESFALIGTPFDDTSGTDVGKAEIFQISNVILGDVNLDGVVDLLDITPFVNLLPGAGFQTEADINQDGLVDLLDINPFVEILTGS